MASTLEESVRVVPVLHPIAVTTATTGSTVDRAPGGIAFAKAMFVVHAGVVTDGTLTWEPEESVDGSTWTAIDAADLDGTFTVLDDDVTDGLVEEIEYLGSKRFLRLKVKVEDGPSTGGVLSAAVVLGSSNTGPV